MKVLKFAEYWVKPISVPVRSIKSGFDTNGAKIKKIAVAAMLAAIAAVMQSAGAFGGPGLVVSALVTLPVSVATILSFYSGIMAYTSTLCLLLILQPSEMIIFPFTTGLLGLGIGLSFILFNKRAAVVAFSALSLSVGMIIVLYIFRFPVLGPSVPTEFDMSSAALIYVFSFFYSWLWVELSMVFLRILGRVLAKAS